MVDIPQVASLAALAALDHANIPATYLSAGGLSGPFVWFSANLSAAVTADVNQGIYVAPSTDPTGASGAWGRQNCWPWRPSWFGVVYDGVITEPVIFGPPTIVSGTDNGPALLAMCRLARYYSSLGLKVDIVDDPPPGSTNVCLFNMNNWGLQVGLCNIKKLKWDMRKVKYRNTLQSIVYPFPVQTAPERSAGNVLLTSEIATTNLIVSVLNLSPNYISASGVVTLALANGQQNLTSGSIFSLQSGLGGTGSFASANVTNALAGAGTIPAGSTTAASGTASYNPATGLVTLTLAATQGLQPGSIVSVTGFTGTGSFASVNAANVIAGPGTTGTTLTYTIATGLTLTLTGTGTVTWNTLLSYVIATGLTMTLTATSAAIQQGSSNTVILLDNTWTPNINVGDRVRVCAGDSAFFGYPSTPCYFEYNQIQSITNVGAGAVIVLESQLRHEYRADYTDQFYSQFNPLAGKARIVAMNSGGWTVDGVANTTILWDIDHEYDNFDLGPTLASNTLWYISGFKFRIVNYSGPGNAETRCGTVEYEQFSYRENGQTDKGNDKIIMRGGKFNPDPGLTGPTTFRPGTMTNSFAAYDVDFSNGGVFLTGAKQALWQNCHMNSVAFQDSGGINESIEVNNCIIDTSPGGFNLEDGAGNVIQTIDNSTSVWYGTAAPATAVSAKAGTLTILKSQFAVTGMGLWSMMPGITFNFLASPTGATNLFTGSGVNATQGTARVLKTYEDPAGSVSIASASYTSPNVTLTTSAAHGLLPGSYFNVVGLTGTGTFANANGTSVIQGGGLFVALAGTTGSTLVYAPLGGTGQTMTLNSGVGTASWPSGPYAYVDTDYQSATLPAWANGKIMIFRGLGAKFINCAGCDAAKQASMAYAKGLEYWEYYPYSFGGAYGASDAWIGQGYGSVTQLVVNVINPGSNSATYFILTFGTFDSTANFVEDSGGSTFKFNVGVTGKRTWTIGAANLIGTDAITVGGASSSTGLPANKVVGSEYTIGFQNLAATEAGNPTFTLEIYFDAGQARKRAPTRFDGSGKQTLTYGFAGNPP